MIDYYVKEGVFELSSGRQIVIKRCGLKYFYLLSGYMSMVKRGKQDTKALEFLRILSQFVEQNIMEFTPEELQETIQEVIRFNVYDIGDTDESGSKKTPNTDQINEGHDYMMTVLATNLAMSPDEISEKINFVQAARLVSQIRQLRSERYRDMAHAATVPYGSDAGEYMASLQGIRTMSLSEIAKEVEKKKQNIVH